VFMDMQGEDRLASGFLTAVARRFEHLRTRPVEVLTAYPNFGVLEGSDRCVIFHHGHFIEPLYRLMSTATSLVFDRPELPADVYALEAENFAWIDFFWSAMGRSGEAGEEVESIYEATNDARSLQAITDSLAANVAKRYRLPVLRFDWLEERVLRKLLRRCVVRRVAAKQERQRSGNGRTEMPLSAGAIEGLRQYLEVMLRRQVEVEHGPMPERVTYVFGHTHKPFQQAMEFEGYSEGVRVLNTGGWVVDTVERDPLHGGAVVVIDEDLNAVNLRIFNEGRYRARVEEPLRPGEAHSALYLEVSQIVNPDREPWQSLGETIDREIEMRAELLKSRIRRRRDDSHSTPEP
jgi:hypothetical protein